jgi:tetratricopeptide (TPR) repeat protein
MKQPARTSILRGVKSRLSVLTPLVAHRRPGSPGLAAVVVVLLASAWSATASGRDPDLVARAQRFLDQEDARSALAVLRDAEKTFGQDRARLVPVLRLEGYALVLLRRDAEAEAAFRRVLELDSSDRYARLELAKRLHARGAFAEARRQYERAFAADPDGAEARDHLRRLSEDERTHAAVAAKIAGGERVIVRLGVLTAVVLVGFGILLRFLLFRRAGGRE